MRIVKMMYGLGNQLFEYAFYKKLKHLYEKDVYVDVEWYNAPDRHPWDVYQLDMLGLFTDEISRKDYCVKDYYISNNNISEKEFDEIETGLGVQVVDLFKEAPYGKNQERIWLLDNVYYFGFYQNIDTVDIGIEYIKKEIRFPEWESKDFNDIKDKIISDDNSVSIHMRMDNHVKEPECYDIICSDAYFKKSIETIREYLPDAFFYVFSNDIDNARRRLADVDNTYFVELKEPHYGIEDMELMSLCRHNIISNSTFSWWAAVLNSNFEKKVIIPDVFDVRMDFIKREDVNLYYPEWIRISG